MSLHQLSQIASLQQPLSATSSESENENNGEPNTTTAASTPRIINTSSHEHSHVTFVTAPSLRPSNSNGLNGGGPQQGQQGQTTTNATATMGIHHDANFPSMPTLARQPSVRIVDWARQVTLEERKFIRDKIRSAYLRKATTYEELMDACVAIEEELLFAVAPSRLDYFKSGVQFEKRVAEKLTQLHSGVIAGMAPVSEKTDETERTVKRSKTQL